MTTLGHTDASFLGVSRGPASLLALHMEVCRDVATSQGIPGAARSWNRQVGASPPGFRGDTACDLILDMWSPQ